MCHLDSLFASDVVGNRKRIATFGATASEDLAAVCCCHSFAEAVLVNALTVRGLECSFHCLIVIFLIVCVVSECKFRYFCRYLQNLLKQNLDQWS